MSAWTGSDPSRCGLRLAFCRVGTLSEASILRFMQQASQKLGQRNLGQRNPKRTCMRNPIPAPLLAPLPAPLPALLPLRDPAPAPAPAPAPHRALQVEADQQPRAVAASCNQEVQAEAHQAPHQGPQAEVARPPAAQAEAARLLLRVEAGGLAPQAAQVEVQKAPVQMAQMAPVQMAPVLACVGLLRRGTGQPPIPRAWPARW